MAKSRRREASPDQLGEQLAEIIDEQDQATITDDSSKELLVDSDIVDLVAAVRDQAMVPTAPSERPTRDAKASRTKDDQGAVDGLVVDIPRVVADFEGDSAEILDCWRRDRAEASEIIEMCRTQIVAAGNAVQRVYVEAMVQALQVKADANQTAVRVLDARSKLLAALKTQLRPKETGATGLNSELTKLLDSPDQTD